MSKRGVLVSALVAFTVSLLGAQSVRTEKDEAALRKTRQEFVAAMNARDADRVVACVSPEVVFLVDNQKPLEEREALRTMLRDHLRRMSAGGVTVELTMETTRLEHSGDLAYELGRYSIVRRLPDGTVQNARGKHVDVWKRQPAGEWRIVVHAPSDDPPQ